MDNEEKELNAADVPMKKRKGARVIDRSKEFPTEKEMDAGKEVEASEEEELDNKNVEEFSVKDDLSHVIEDLKETEEDKKKRQDEERERVLKQRAKEKKKIENKRNRRTFINKVLDLNTYKKFIQHFEPFIEVVSKDAIYITMIASILYSFYIIVTMSSQEFNWLYILFKVLGSAIVTTLCYILLDNWGENVEPDKSEDE